MGNLFSVFFFQIFRKFRPLTKITIFDQNLENLEIFKEKIKKNANLDRKMSFYRDPVLRRVYITKTKISQKSNWANQEI